MSHTNDKMRRGTIKKYRAIQERFKVLYDVNRLRYDDCIDKLMEEFYIESRPTLSRIMCMELPELPPESDPAQMTIFMAGVDDPAMQLAATG